METDFYDIVTEVLQDAFDPYMFKPRLDYEHRTFLDRGK